MNPMMTTMTIAALGATAAILFTTLGAARAAGAEPMVGTSQLHKLAKGAVTAADHVKVARMFRLQAEALHAKAAAHEDAAKEWEALPKTAMTYKWPAMAPLKGRQERELALQAQRAARELLALASKHIELAVELREVESSGGQ
ncbi:MAG: hypothetical protein ABI972_13885 [Acidobacteriota bacterium]